MIINSLITDRFTFDNWVRDSRGYWNALSKMIIAGEISTQVMLTIEESDSEKVNTNTQMLSNNILEDIQMLDNDGDDFRTGTLLESQPINSVSYTLMFFK